MEPYLLLTQQRRGEKKVRSTKLDYCLHGVLLYDSSILYSDSFGLYMEDEN